MRGLVALAARLAADDDAPSEIDVEDDASLPETDGEGDSQSFLEEIENTEATEAEVAAARSFIGQFNYTTTALTALSIALGEMEDNEGSMMLLKAALDMAKHEAKTA